MNAKQRRQEKRKYKYIVQLVQRGFSSHAEIQTWLDENPQIDYRSVAWRQYEFASEADATFFTLKWL